MFTDSIKNGPQNATHRSLYHALGLTQEELARRLGVSKGTVGNYESGARTPRKLDDLNSLADYFNVEIDYLLGRSNSRPEYDLEEQWIISCYRNADEDTRIGIKSILRRFDKKDAHVISAS